MTASATLFGARKPRAARATGRSTYPFQDSFDSKNTSAWTWNSQQTVPHSHGGSNVVKSTGTGSNWNGTFYRSATLGTGQGLMVRFKVDAANTQAHFSVETSDGSRRFGVRELSGKLVAQYGDGNGWRTPVDVIPNFLTNTWYVVRIVLDDARGFYLEVYQESAPTVRGSYQQWMPTGQAWRFRHWIYSGNAYLDDYREFGTGDLTWEPDERMNFSYDALNRLIATAPDSGASGYRHTYAYTADGNILSRTDVGSYAYPPAGQARPHAATAAGANSYGYDPNGNMTARTEKGVTYTQTWDEENRLQTVTVGGQTTTYFYDGDGRRVKKLQGGQTTVYIGNYYEKNLTTNTVTTYYYANGQRVAERRGSAVYYFTGDHLGSTSLQTNASGSEVGRQKYYPYGALRFTSGTLATDYRFTGQRSEEAALGSLYDYGARFYSPVLGRFLSADTIVPSPGDPQSLNRYAYTLNNPLRYTDPTGHLAEEELQTLLGNEYDTLMKLWQRYDSYWLSVLINVQAGGTLWASLLGGTELHFEGSGSNIQLNVYNGNGPSQLKDWQGQGVYRWQNPGMSEKQSYAARDTLFNVFATDNMLLQPSFDYGYDKCGTLRPDYRGAIPIIQSIDVNV